MNVLSLFDGMSCGQIALNKIGITDYTYYASEIKPSAIKTTKHHFPNTIHIGDVKNVSYKNGVLLTDDNIFNVGKIDLFIGGSPCQDFSLLRACSGNSVDGLNGQKSVLFYEYLRLLKEIQPTYFLLENVKMKRERERERERERVK